MEAKNELGVIVVFAENAKETGYEILAIRAGYPDAVIRYGGDEYKAEFEYLSSNFIEHGHDERECDLVICWEHDTDELIVPVLELSDPDWKTALIYKAEHIEKELSYWKRIAKQEKRRADSLQIKLDAKEGRQVTKDYNLTTREKILAYYRDHPKATQTQVASVIGVSRARVGQYLEQFKEAGILNGTPAAVRPAGDG